MNAPSDAQNGAIVAIEEWYRGGRRTPQVFYLAGYAGTGKSFVAAHVVGEFKAKHKNFKVCTAAFTGQAASVLRRKGISDAMTIHSMIYGAPESEGHPEPSNKTQRDFLFAKNELKFTVNKESAARDAALIVLDECSMVDQALANDVMSFGKKILVMGDPGQLPPVRGQGAFTAKRPHFFLEEVHRQAAESPIIRLATMARRGEDIAVADYGNGTSVRPLSKDTQALIYRRGTQAICGVHRVRWVYSQRIRRDRGFDGPVPQAGETLLCRKNDKQLGVYNGQAATLLSEPFDLDYGRLNMRVQLDAEGYNPPIDVEVDPFLFAQHFIGPTPQPKMRHGVQWFDWGYLRTCHAAQGSEYEDVTVIDDSRALSGVVDPAKWLYTAITRASERLTLMVRV